MKTTTVLKGILSLITALFLILQLLLIGSAAFIRPNYEENWTIIPGPPLGVSTEFNISNNGLFAIQGFKISVSVYNETDTYLEGSVGPDTIQQFSTKTIAVDLFLVGPPGHIADGDYTLLATVSGYFLWQLISFDISVNITDTFTFPLP
ncbi:MAG: hypothetical protein GF329_19650 [Candidatus Lokiarchaeota archaeon]|nr:hypothetical protein [Candidatus Lokiarchaeota archaeon]